MLIIIYLKQEDLCSVFIKLKNIFEQSFCSTNERVSQYSMECIMSNRMIDIFSNSNDEDLVSTIEKLIDVSHNHWSGKVRNSSVGVLNMFNRIKPLLFQGNMNISKTSDAYRFNFWKAVAIKAASFDITFDVLPFLDLINKHFKCEPFNLALVAQ